MPKFDVYASHPDTPDKGDVLRVIARTDKAARAGATAVLEGSRRTRGWTIARVENVSDHAPALSAAEAAEVWRFEHGPDGI